MDGKCYFFCVANRGNDATAEQLENKQFRKMCDRLEYESIHRNDREATTSSDQFDMTAKYLHVD